MELVERPLQAGSSIGGLSFYFQINGRPVFMKGSNWIPAHALPEQVSRCSHLTVVWFTGLQAPARMAGLLQSASEAHFNMLRVWGGGVSLLRSH